MPYIPLTEQPGHTLLSRVITRAILNTPDHIVMYTIPPDVGDGAIGIRYRVHCQKCKVFEEISAADWSEHFDIDNLIQTVLSFISNHEHAETPPERVFLH